MEFANQIICGDCLEVLAQFPPDSIDLIYVDPPFFTKKQYAVIWGNHLEVREYSDRWIVNENHKKATKSIDVYLEWIEPRLQACHRVLKPTGSFYLHCDWHANAYLRILLGSIFGEKNFRAEIIWSRYQYGHYLSKEHDHVTDTLFRYTKSQDYVFNSPKIPLTEELETKRFPHIEQETGRAFRHCPLEHTSNAYNKNEPRTFYKPDGTAVKKSHSKLGWKWTQETIDTRWKESPHLFYFTKTGRVRYKLYADESAELRLTNLWLDIPSLSSRSKERLGYPTQKPEALLERIIKVSSNEGDLILDPVLGGGTTIAVAKYLKRRWIGIDISPIACQVSARRLGITKWKIVGYTPLIEELERLKPKIFQKWIVQRLGGIPNPQLIGDMGIDGYLEGNPVQVKRSKSVSRPVVDNFETAIRREGKERGTLIALSFSPGAKKEAARAKRKDGLQIELIDTQKLLELGVLREKTEKERELEKKRTMKPLTEFEEDGD